jgi:uncharacterized protein YdeI (YjbR/CyaY-like superfamily)
MKETNPKVDWFFEKATQWQPEYQALRKLVLDCGLTEELKWGCPCYTFNQNNVVLIHGFKEYCALLFHKGVLLQDAHGLLIQQTENVQSTRQIRFSDIREIIESQDIIKSYVFDAILVEKSGQKVELKKTTEFKMPEEFQQTLDENPSLKSAFAALTPGRQRAYLLHFSAPKQAKTRLSRIENAMLQIMDGKGLNDM